MNSKRASRVLFSILQAFDTTVRQRDHEFFARLAFWFRNELVE